MQTRVNNENPKTGCHVHNQESLRVLLSLLLMDFLSPLSTLINLRVETQGHRAPEEEVAEDRQVSNKSLMPETLTLLS